MSSTPNDSTPSITNRSASPAPLTVALACDAAYAMPLATTLRSMAESNGDQWPIAVHVLVHEFPRTLRVKVESSLPSGAMHIHWIDIDLGQFDGFSTTVGLSPMTFARLLLADVLPATAHRVLYLDTDVLVLGQLQPLWKTNLGGAVVAAVRDGMDSRQGQAKATTSQIPDVTAYFNAGVLLIDLDKWRSLGIKEKCLAYLRSRPDTPYSDQDALNVACDGHWQEVPVQWNFQTLYHRALPGVRAGQNSPRIIHFITGDKPWKASIPNPYADFYDAFRQRTRFARTGWNRAQDAVTSSWAHAKLSLKRISMVRSALNRFHGRSVFNPSK